MQRTWKDFTAKEKQAVIDRILDVSPEMKAVRIRIWSKLGGK